MTLVFPGVGLEAAAARPLTGPCPADSTRPQEDMPALSPQETRAPDLGPPVSTGLPSGSPHPAETPRPGLTAPPAALWANDSFFPIASKALLHLLPPCLFPSREKNPPGRIEVQSWRICPDRGSSLCGAVVGGTGAILTRQPTIPCAADDKTQGTESRGDLPQQGAQMRRADSG